ncbi:ATP-dependent Zn protease [Candidatus Phytoplasma luffae]|uniref:ATP-dependent zinc metalloprotease FtsH n=1 Tax=Loofah witches'-broom phytoplasma TaxID=35773 RepID=A0A975ILT7_LOWBP|nr:ATP-dependent zinc metalloprotease FtsH [Candidatus Phytoplasma luffae]QTX02767.1 ATP-dependent Zn protease [Candidatus Phytoplasma luffae]
MKHLNNFIKSIKKNFWYIIGIILLISFFMSILNQFNKPHNPYAGQILQVLEGKNKDIDCNYNDFLSENSEKKVTVSGIKKITPILSKDILSNKYELQVEYLLEDNKKTKTISYYNVNETIYNEIRKKLNELDIEKNINISGPVENDPYRGFYPFLKTFNFCITLILFYFLIDFFQKSTSHLTEHFVDKRKIENKKDILKYPKLTFDNIAGAEEEKEEMQELVDFLKNPKKYSAIGARIPKGVLLSGLPGTGKTLLAKTLAGEAKVPFFAVSGSEFVEMFVGLGASRIRNLFRKAEINAPCIIFIDEIETLARKRGISYGNSEQEQTLNQLLVELDGFNPNEGVIVIAATNQPDMLDPALLRPGRFDRRFVINLPSVKDREAILKLHASNKKLASNVDLSDLAKETPGFSGAQLEGILNEAALLSIRNNSEFINKEIISEAVDRILLGFSKKSRQYSEKEKKLVSYHESGHAVIGLKLKDSKKVQKITIIPRGKAGGYNLMLKQEETFFTSKTQLLDEITALLGGRAAEELFLDDISDGAYQDLQMATQIANKMVTIFGMSDLGLAQFDSSKNNFHKNFSDSKALEIDEAVQKIIFNCYEKAKKIILDNKELLFKISDYLLELETLNKKDIDEIYETGKISWVEEKEDKSKDYNEEKLSQNNSEPETQNDQSNDINK